MTKKLVGHVDPEEQKEIKALFERRNGLTELAGIVTGKDSELYERVVTDLGKTSTDFQKWWSSMAAKYQWESSENGSWEIDFETSDIYLVINDEK